MNQYNPPSQSEMILMILGVGLVTGLLIGFVGLFIRWVLI